MSWQTPEQRREYQKRRYHNGKKAEIRAATKAWIAKNKPICQQHIWDYLSSHPCIDCGNSDPRVLEFDHLGDKVYQVGQLGQGHHSLAKVKREIAKCVVRCANCHRIKTQSDFGFWRSKMEGTE